jgi:hypothetical protein
MPASSTSDVQRTVAEISVGTLSAEYSVGISKVTGDWVAVGTVHRWMSSSAQPTWVLVGTGPTEPDAVDDMRHELERLERTQALG